MEAWRECAEGCLSGSAASKRLFAHLGGTLNTALDISSLSGQGFCALPAPINFAWNDVSTKSSSASSEMLGTKTKSIST